MPLVPIRRDRTSKPPAGTPLRSDGHWSVQGLADAFDLSQGSAGGVFGANGTIATVVGSVAFDQYGAIFSGGGLVSLGKIIGTTGKLTYLAGASPSLLNYSNDNIVVGYGDRATLRFYSPAASNFFTYNGSTWEGVDSLGKTFAIDGWYVMAAVHSATTNKIYCDGELVGSASATPRNSPSPLDLTLGGDAENPGRKLTGRIAWAFIFNRDLSSWEIASLSANPWQIYEPETAWVEVGGGAEAALFAGTIYGQSSASAQLSTAITIASQVVASGNISGGIDTAIRMATNTQGAASASALLTTAIRMAASAQGYGSASAPLSTSIRMGANAQGSGSTTAGITTSIRLGSTTAGAGSATANLSTVIALAAEIIAASSSSGALTTAIRFGGSLSGSSTATAALTNAITMAAQVVGLGSISGQLSGTVAAALFSGTISGSSSASANLSTAVVLAAAAQGSATAQAALSTALELAARVNGFGSAAGTLGADVSGLAGSLHGSSEAQATLSTAIHLIGIAAGQCGVVGRLAEPVEILAQLRVMASDPLALTISVRDPLALRVTVH